MRVDHVSYAAEKDGVRATADRLAEQLGARALNGGVHPSFGTRNVVIPLAHERYLEVVEPLDHPATDKAPFGRAVKAACSSGGGWLGWTVRVDDITELERRLGREATPGHRVFPDGRRLEWLQLGVNGLLNDPQLPYFVQFTTPELHPSAALAPMGVEHPKVTIAALTIAGDPQRVCEWLGLPPEKTSSVIDFTWIAPKGQAGLMEVTFGTAHGTVTI